MSWAFWSHNLWRGGGRQKRPHPHCKSCAGLPWTSCNWRRGKWAEGKARNRKGGSKWRDHTRGWPWRWHGWRKLEPKCMCVCENEDTTTLPKKCARRSVDVVTSVRIVKCLPRKHGCRHWRSYRGASRKHTCRHWHSCCALSPTRT